MICNGQHLNITMGTDVVLRDTLIFDGETFDPSLSVGITANLVSSLGKRTPLEVEVADGALIIYVPWVERNAGYYGLEVTGTCNSKKWATYADSLIHYTRATEIGVAEVTIDSDYYDIIQEVGFRYSTSPIDTVTVTIDGNVGEPEGDAEYDGHTLAFDFKNMKGNPFTFDDFTPEQLESLRGPQGASAVFDPETGNILATLHNTIGYDDANAMTQKAVTDALMYGDVEFSLSAYSVESGVYIKAADNVWKVTNNNDNACYIIPVTPGMRIKAVGRDKGDGTKYVPQVVFLKTNTYSDNASTVNQYAGGVNTYPTWTTGETKVVPEDAAYMYVRTKTSGSNVTPTLYLVMSVREKVAALDESSDNQAQAIADIEEKIMEEISIPTYRWGKISSDGYSNNGSTETNKVSQEYIFDPNEVTSVEARLPNNSGLKFAVYTITGTTFAALSGGWVTENYSFIPVSGTKYVLRISPSATPVTRAAMEAIDPSLYPYFLVKYNTARRIDDMEARIAKMEQRAYGYHRNYSNITPLLTFENKVISVSGISDSASSLLAKLPNIGCVEVKMNKPVGGFSVWKKVGTTITCLQAYTHYQYRYTGDYESEFYVMLQAETGETLSTAIATVYTYSDEGKAHNYLPPTWAAGKKVAFIGDSIVQGRYPKNSSEGVNLCMDKPWPNLVAEALGTEDYTDFAIGGATVYDSDWKSLQRNASLITDYDVVFVCGGTNDYGSKISEANFESAYADMLDTLIANNTKVIAMTPVYRTKTVSNPAMQMSGYVASVTEVAEAKEVDIIPTYDLTQGDDFVAHLVDGLHPDETGQRIIADIVLEEINKL